MGKLLLLWLHEAGPTDIGARLACHPPSLNAVLFLAAKEDLPPGVRNQLFELALNLLVDHTQVVRLSIFWLGAYAMQRTAPQYIGLNSVSSQLLKDG
jgi:hypothetical protein